MPDEPETRTALAEFEADLAKAAAEFEAEFADGLADLADFRAGLGSDCDSAAAEFEDQLAAAASEFTSEFGAILAGIGAEIQRAAAAWREVITPDRRRVVGRWHGTFELEAKPLRAPPS